MPVTVVVSETTREADGLAMSSRNAYMSSEERAAAPAVYLSLRAAADARQRAAEAGRCVVGLQVFASTCEYLPKTTLINTRYHTGQLDPNTARSMV